MTSIRKYPAAKNASESIQTVLLNVRNDGGECILSIRQGHRVKLKKPPLLDRANRLLGGLVQTIANGRELRRAEIGGAIRAVIELKNIQAVLVRNPGSNTWLLTGWELKPDVTNAANDATGTTHPMADSSDHTAGAGKEIITQRGEADNGDIAFRRATLAKYTKIATDRLNEVYSHPGKISLWDKTVGSMYHLAERSAPFKRGPARA